IIRRSLVLMLFFAIALIAQTNAYGIMIRARVVKAKKVTGNIQIIDLKKEVITTSNVSTINILKTPLKLKSKK
ncbi:hypothetical protein ACFL2K_01625, partial [Candidatus Margulisiibacteriota bacterium]